MTYQAVQHSSSLAVVRAPSPRIHLIRTPSVPDAAHPQYHTAHAAKSNEKKPTSPYTLYSENETFGFDFAASDQFLRAVCTRSGVSWTALQNQMLETTVSVHFVPEMRRYAFDFADAAYVLHVSSLCVAREPMRCTLAAYAMHVSVVLTCSGVFHPAGFPALPSLKFPANTPNFRPPPPNKNPKVKTKMALKTWGRGEEEEREHCGEEEHE